MPSGRLQCAGDELAEQFGFLSDDRVFLPELDPLQVQSCRLQFRHLLTHFRARNDRIQSAVRHENGRCFRSGRHVANQLRRVRHVAAHPDQSCQRLRQTQPRLQCHQAESVVVDSSVADDIKRRLKAYLARYRWRNEGFYELLNSEDAVIKKALEVIAN